MVSVSIHDPNVFYREDILTFLQDAATLGTSDNQEISRFLGITPEEAAGFYSLAIYGIFESLPPNRQVAYMITTALPDMYVGGYMPDYQMIVDRPESIHTAIQDIREDNYTLSPNWANYQNAAVGVALHYLEEGKHAEDHLSGHYTDEMRAYDRDLNYRYQQGEINIQQLYHHLQCEELVRPLVQQQERGFAHDTYIEELRQSLKEGRYR
jgi:hypothetical protein